jgi:hypothetical protein
MGGGGMHWACPHANEQAFLEARKLAFAQGQEWLRHRLGLG